MVRNHSWRNKILFCIFLISCYDTLRMHTHPTWGGAKARTGSADVNRCGVDPRTSRDVRANQIGARQRPCAGTGRCRDSTPRGFEPLRAEPNGFQVHLLSHSDTVSDTPDFHEVFHSLDASVWNRMFPLSFTMMYVRS